MQQRLVKAGLVLVGYHQNVVLAAVECLPELLVGRDIPSLFVKVHGRFGKRLIAGVILQCDLAGERDHSVAADTFVRMGFDIPLDGKVVPHGVSAAVSYNHSLAFPVDLIPAVFHKVCHNHIGFLRNGVAVLFVILKQCAGGFAFNQLRVVL